MPKPLNILDPRKTKPSKVVLPRLIGFKEPVWDNPWKKRRLYGAIFEWCGNDTYLALRSRAEKYRNGRFSVALAEQENVDAWAIDAGTLIEVASRGVTHAGVWEWDTGRVYVTEFKNWEDRSYLIDYYDRGGALQRVLHCKSLTLTIGGKTIAAVTPPVPAIP